VVVVDTARKAITGQLAGGQWPHDNHLSPDGTRLYNASIGTIVAPGEARAAMSPPPYQLTVASTDGLRTLRTYAFERGIRPIVIAHDEKRMFAQLSEYHGLIEFDLEAGRIVRQLDLPVDAGVTEDDYDFEAPHHGLAISPDEKTLCAAGRASDYVALVSAETLTTLAVIDVDDAPGWAATGPDGRACFVPNTRADTMSVISYAERREVARVKMGDGPKQIEAARLPQEAICVDAGVPGCTRAVRLRVRCDGRRVRLALRGALDEVYGVRFAAGRRALGRRSEPPFAVRRRVRAKRVRAVVRTAGDPIRLARRTPRCR
jgi:DNA-binding beta-propeller fold protein YncE